MINYLNKVKDRKQKEGQKQSHPKEGPGLHIMKQFQDFNIIINSIVQQKAQRKTISPERNSRIQDKPQPSIFTNKIIKQRCLTLNVDRTKDRNSRSESHHRLNDDSQYLRTQQKATMNESIFRFPRKAKITQYAVRTSQIFYPKSSPQKQKVVYVSRSNKQRYRNFKRPTSYHLSQKKDGINSMILKDHIPLILKTEEPKKTSSFDSSFLEEKYSLKTMANFTYKYHPTSKSQSKSKRVYYSTRGTVNENKVL